MFYLFDDLSGIVLGKFVSYVKAIKAKKYYQTGLALDGSLTIEYRRF